MTVFHIPLQQSCVYRLWTICLYLKKTLKRGKLELLTKGSWATFICLSGEATMSCLSRTTPSNGITICKDKKIQCRLSKKTVRSILKGVCKDPRMYSYIVLEKGAAVTCRYSHSPRTYSKCNALKSWMQSLVTPAQLLGLTTSKEVLSFSIFSKTSSHMLNYWAWIKNLFLNSSL